MEPQVKEFVQHVNEADAILVGGGSGLSNAAGMDFWYEASPLFMKHMKYFYDKYHFKGLFNGFYTHFDSPEERWAFFLIAWKMVFEIPAQKKTYEYLRTVIGDKPYHLITTNQDGLFKQYFPADSVSEIQGSHYLLQSKNTETDKHLYDNQAIVERLLPKIKNHRLPREDFPVSPIDGAPPNLLGTQSRISRRPTLPRRIPKDQSFPGATRWSKDPISRDGCRADDPHVHPRTLLGNDALYAPNLLREHQSQGCADQSRN